MKVFITGSSGFIGKELAAHLEGKHEIVPYDRAQGQDIRDFESLKQAMRGCDAVVHLAALRKPFEDKTFEDYFSINCDGTRIVAEAALACGVKRLVYSSSTSYYGLEKGMPFPASLSEDTPILAQRLKEQDLECRDCDIAYSTSKVIGEQVLANYGLTKKFSVVILRLGPTRPRGEHRPFGSLGLHLKIENALQAIELSLGTEKEILYDAFTILDENPAVDLSKAKAALGYVPR